MRKALKIIAIVLVLAFVALQLFRPEFSNPQVIQTETLESTTEVPEPVKQILSRSCADCHTHETRYPWYSYIQPSASFLSTHIAEGREELNFSVWSTYNARRKKRKFDEICEMAKSREMPLPSYLWIHWDATLSDAEIQTLCDWAELEKAKIVE